MKAEQRQPQDQRVGEIGSGLGEPGDLIGSLLVLASDASAFVSGVVLPVDGGFSAYSGV